MVYTPLSQNKQQNVDTDGRKDKNGKKTHDEEQRSRRKVNIQTKRDLHDGVKRRENSPSSSSVKTSASTGRTRRCCSAEKLDSLAYFHQTGRALHCRAASLTAAVSAASPLNISEAEISVCVCVLGGFCLDRFQKLNVLALSILREHTRKRAATSLYCSDNKRFLFQL